MHAASVSRLRILVIDDNPSIQEDFRKIFTPAQSRDAALAAAQQALFGDEPQVTDPPKVVFDLDVASQAEEGLRRLVQAQAQANPYAVVFVDVRMPPGMDGILAAGRILRLDPDVQVVICTAFSDYSWDEMHHQLGRSDRILILKKPFDIVEVLQLADTLGIRWQLARKARQHLGALDHLIDARTRELEFSKRKLDVLQQQLEAAAQRHQLQAVKSCGRRSRINESELKRAIETGQLSVHYQPLIECHTRRLASLEALARWEHPQLGWIAPDDFIPLAEATGLILPLGEYVLHQVCQQVVSWQREQLNVVPVAVNISAIQLQQDLTGTVRRVLRTVGMRPELLALEITESALISDTQSHSKHLQALRNDGVLIEIDDFGTGYSSLSYLRQLPVDTLKIDRSFISNIEVNKKDEAIVSAIITMAHTLGVKVVAEGVETAAQLATLRSHGCEFVQGYFVSRPMPAVQCRNWFDAAWRHDVATQYIEDRVPNRMAAMAR